MNERIEIEVAAEEHRKRLEDFLCDRFIGLSKMYLRDIVKNEKCAVNGRFENRGFLVRSNDFIEIELDPSRETAMQPENVAIEIVFEDEQLMVVNKPAGMLVHPTHRDKNGTLLNALTFYLNREGLGEQKGKRGKGDEEFTFNSLNFASSPVLPVSSQFTRPGLIHRLDKQTSGLMVIAKTPRSHRILADHFQRKIVKKRYLALVQGIVEADDGVIEAPIGRFADLKRWDVKSDGKTAVTRFWVKKRYGDAQLLELEPVTGRTNQLRIHCAHIGHPIVGDVARGGKEFCRLCLHAYKLAFRHPNGGEKLEFQIDPPPEMTQSSHFLLISDFSQLRPLGESHFNQVK